MPIYQLTLLEIRKMRKRFHKLKFPDFALTKKKHQNRKEANL